jgi:hypothetical protein
MDSRKAVSYLGLSEDGAEAVEELERSDNLALNKCARDNCSCCPPSSTQWHCIKSASRVKEEVV